MTGGAREPMPGDRVAVLYGQWAGREGILVRYHFNPGSLGGQQGQSYPVVDLEPRGRARSRVVRVLAVRAT